MSKQANPRLIGAFVLGAIVLSLFLLALVSSFRSWEDRRTFVLYFQSSVNNLNVGAPVKWKGVPVGKVSDIRIRWNQDDLSADVPVFVEINLDRLSMELDDKRVLQAEIHNGMRGQLSLESIISGLLFIELNYVPDAGPPRFVQREDIFPEIPTVPSPFDEIGEMATNLAAKVQDIDLERISRELTSVLENTNKLLRDLDAANLSRSLRQAANSVSDIVGSPEALRAVDNLGAAAEEARVLMSRLGESAGPVVADIHQLTENASAALRTVSSAAQRLQTVIAPDSELLYNLEVALGELSSAARAARDLSEFLERNPRALLTGRKGPETE